MVLKDSIKQNIYSIGMFLLGLGVLIISIVFYKIYIDEIKSNTYEGRPFYAECYDRSLINSVNRSSLVEDRYIIVYAWRDLYNISVKDENNNILCNYEKIYSGSEELCKIGESKIAIVEAYYNGKLYKDVVTCNTGVIVYPEPKIV